MRKQGRRSLVATVAVVALMGFPAVDAVGVSVEEPQVNVPKLLPDTQLPQLPGGGDSVSVPELPRLPQLPGGGGGGGGGSLPSVPDPGSLLGDGSGGSGDSGTGGGGGAASPGAVPSAGGSSSAPASRAPAAGSGSTASSATGGGDSPTARSQRRQEQRAEERELRETVAELASCVSTLSARERPVVVMRAGLYGMPAVSRARVGKRLDIPVRRVRALERRAVASLRSAARSGGCGRNAPPASADVSGVPPLISNASVANVPALVSPAEMGSGGDADDAPQVRGASRASSDGPDGGSPAAGGLNPVGDSGGLPLVLGLLLMLVLFGIFLALGVAVQRRRLPPAAPQGAGAPFAAASHAPAQAVHPAAPVEPVQPVETVQPTEPVVTGAAPVAPRPDVPPVVDPRPSAVDVQGEPRANGRARRLGAPAAILASVIASLLLSRLFKGGFASRVLGRARRR